MYFCRNCGSHNVFPFDKYGQKNYGCNECGVWELWRNRLVIGKAHYQENGLPTIIPFMPTDKTKRKWMRIELALILIAVPLAIYQLIRIWQ